MPNSMANCEDELAGKSVEELLILVSDEDLGFKPEAIQRLTGMGLDSIYDVLDKAIRNDADANLRNGAMEMMVNFGRESIPRLVDLLHDANEEVRNFSTVMLGDIGSREAVPHLILSLHDPDVNVSHGAAEALGRIGDRSALFPLTELLKEEFWVQYPAVVALGEMRDRRAVPVLLQHIDNELLLLPIIEALGKIGDFRAQKTLGTLLSTVADEFVSPLAIAMDAIYRSTAEEHYCNSISEIFDRPVMTDLIQPDGAVRLRKLLEDVPYEEGIGASIRILGWLGDVSALPVFFQLVEKGVYSEAIHQAIMAMGKRAVPHLAEGISHRCAEVRALSLRLLRWINAPLEPGVLKNVVADPDHQVRIEGLEILKGTTDPSFLPLLRERFNENDPDILTGALKVLGEFPPETIRSFLAPTVSSSDPREREIIPRLLFLVPGALPADDLIPFFSDPDPHVRGAALAAAGISGKSEYAKYIEMRVGDDNEEVRVQAVIALGDLGSSSSVAMLLSLLGKWGSAFDYTLLKAVGKIGCPEAGSALINFLARGGHTRLQEYAILESLTRTKGTQPDSVQVVLQYFTHPDSDIRRIAVSACAAISIPAVADALVAAAADRHWSVRIAALETLAGSFPEAAQAPLAKALADPDPLVRKNVITLLGSLRSVRSIKDLVQLLTDPDLGRAAFDALLNIGKSGLPILHRYMKSPYQMETRERVIDLVGKIADRHSIDPLMELLSDPNPAIRLTAIDSLVFCFDTLPLRRLMALKNRDTDDSVREKADLALKILTMEKFL